MKTARLFAWILTLALFLGCAAFPAGAEDELKLLSIVSIEGDTIWMNTSAGLAPFAKDGKQTGEAILPGADCYAIGTDGNIYYSLDGTVFKADKAGNELGSWETPIEKLNKILATDNHIIFLGNDVYGTILMADGTLKSAFSDKLEYFGDIGLYNADSFVLADGSSLSIIDCTTLNEIKHVITSSYDSIVRSSEAKGIYCYASGTVYSLGTLDAEAESYMKLTDKNYVDDVMLGENALYVIYKGGLRSYNRPSKNAEKKTLTIVGGTMMDYDDRYKKTVERFEELYPEYTVKVTGIPTPAKFNTSLMANDPGYDLLYLDYLDGLAQYKMSGMFKDLSENSVITDNIAQYAEMPFLYESSGSLYAIPTQVWPHGFWLDAALWNDLGVDIDPKNWTWDDLFALADKARERGLFLTSDDAMWSTIRMQYETVYCDIVAGAVNYDTETFRNLAAMWKQLENEKLLAHSHEEKKHVLLKYAYMPMLQDDLKDCVYLGMPLLDGEAVTPIRIDGLYINKYSENADIAEKFLEILSSPEMQNWGSGPATFFMPDLEQNGFYRFLEENNVLHMFYKPTAEDLEEWQYYLKTGRMYDCLVIEDDYLTDPIASFIADKLTLEEFIAEAQERANLFAGE